MMVMSTCVQAAERTFQQALKRDVRPATDLMRAHQAFQQRQPAQQGAAGSNRAPGDLLSQHSAIEWDGIHMNSHCSFMKDLHLACHISHNAVQGLMKRMLHQQQQCLSTCCRPREFTRPARPT